MARVINRRWPVRSRFIQRPVVAVSDLYQRAAHLIYMVGWHLLHRLTQIDWRYLQRYAIFRDRPPRDDDPLISEEVRDAAVGERYVAVLGGNELLDQRANRSCGRSASGVGRDVAAEAILELLSS